VEVAAGPVLAARSPVVPVLTTIDDSPVVDIGGAVVALDVEVATPVVELEELVVVVVVGVTVVVEVVVVATEEVELDGIPVVLGAAPVVNCVTVPNRVKTMS
jgi:hypothetical protein